MDICLKTEALQAQKRQIQLTVNERLPEHVVGPISLMSDVSVELVRPHYVLTLLASSVLAITCQRCLGVFQHDYRHCSQLAVCATEAEASTFMEQWECIVADNGRVDLVALLVDDLHLFAPIKHEHEADCDGEISTLINA